MSDPDMSRHPNPERRDAAGSRMGRMATWVGVVLVLAGAALGLRWHPWAREPERSAARGNAEGERVDLEVQSKAETDEKALFSRMGLIVPLNPGARGKLGAIPVRWIPPGRFTMGSPASEEGRDSAEAPHEVVLSQGFFLAETECTQAQWEAVMRNNPSDFKRPNRPVENVSWDDTVAFCQKLTAQQRAAALLPEGWAWRLPTEAEWEYAARAGTTGPRYGELDAIAWHDGNSRRATHPVGGKQANAWGLHDMIGNVWEWCSDWHGKYPVGSVTDPSGSGLGSYRVGRGGGWRFGPKYCRAANRSRFDPGNRFSYLGFRPALSPAR